MGRPRKKVPQYKKHKTGQGYARYTVGSGKSAERKTIYFGEYDSEESRQAYRDFLEEFGFVDQPPTTADLKRQLVYTLQDLIDRFEKYYPAYYGMGRTSEGPKYKIALDWLATAHDLDTKMGHKFGPRDLKRVQQVMIDADLSRGYINAMIKRLIRFFRWCASEELIKPSVYLGLQTVESLKQGKSGAREAPEVVPVEHADFLATLPWLNPVIRAMVIIQRYSGMRPQDVCNLRPCDLNREHAVWLYLPESHKNSWRNKKLIKAIPKIAQTALLPFLDREPEQYCFSPREALEAIGRGPGNRRKKKVGTRYTTTAYRRGIVYGFEKAERQKPPVILERWTPNQLRHLAATELDGLLGREAAQKWLGHSTLDTTAIYAERQESELRELAERLDSHWGDSLPEVNQPETGDNSEPSGHADK